MHPRSTYTATRRRRAWHAHLLPTVPATVSVGHSRSHHRSQHLSFMRPSRATCFIVQTDKTHIHKARSRSTCTAARRRRARVQISPSRSATLNLTIVVGICLSIVCPVQHASSSRPTRRTSMTYTRDRHTRRHADDEPRVHTSLRRCPPPSRSATLDPTNVVGVCLSPVCPVQHHAHLIMQYTVGIIFSYSTCPTWGIPAGIFQHAQHGEAPLASFFDMPNVEKYHWPHLPTAPDMVQRPRATRPSATSLNMPSVGNSHRHPSTRPTWGTPIGTIQLAQHVIAKPCKPAPESITSASRTPISRPSTFISLFAHHRVTVNIL